MSLAIRISLFDVWRRLGLTACVAIAVLSVVPRSSAAATASPGWAIAPLAAPTSFTEAKNTECAQNHGGFHPACDAYLFTVANAGTLPTDGSPITLTATIPAGITAQRVALYATVYESAFHAFLDSPPEDHFCTISPVRCVYRGEVGPHEEIFPSELLPQRKLIMAVWVTVAPGTPPGPITVGVTAEGGGSTSKSASVTNVVNTPTPAFGFDGFSLAMNGVDGQSDRQAGDHPNEVRTLITLNNAFLPENENGNPTQTSSIAAPKDIVVDLPVGLVGSILAAPECRLSEMSGRGCPPDTVVGEIVTRPETGASSVHSKIWNLVPERGYPAEFGYEDVIHGAHVLYARVVATPAGYVLQTTSPDIPTISLAQIEVVFYGDPAKRQQEIALEEEKVSTPLPEVPFFTNPTGCSGEPLVATVYMDAWKDPGSFSPDGTPNVADGKWAKAESAIPPVTGCGNLRFESQLLAQPTTHEADKPSGLDFELNVPQSEKMGAIATAALKRTVASFPEGFTVDPSAGDGLAACSEAQIGWEESSPGTMKFNGAPPSCPQASKIGTLELETPLVPHKLEGELFLAAQNENPFHSTLATYIVVNDPITGVLIKIAGKLEADPHTGRLTATFPENPSLPFSNLKLHFFGGPRASLATPEHCGSFTTTTEMEPWSAPASGPPDAPFDQFLIDEACPSGFDPSFNAGSTNLQSGAYSPFLLSLSRSDKDQELAGLSETLPPGLLAKLSGVTLCSDADATAGTCPEASRIGTVHTGAGPGPNPLFVTGKIYLTGPYRGAPYGESVVVPAVAGPFNFGTVVVRGAIYVDPLTAQAKVVSDPFPTIIDGIPLRLRRVDVTLDRPEFTFNPTDCEKLGFTGAISGSPLGAPTTLNGTVGYATEPGATVSVGAPFQVTNCAKLAFKPSFKVSTSGKTSRANGASLDVKLLYPSGSFGKDANVKSVKVNLPKQLPSRLTTLQKACPDTTFKQNPAACPAASRVGSATATTPIFAYTLTGPAYFVSHGGAEFPELVIVLSGNGITVQLHGETFISKAGITSSTFRQVPDVPIGSFELKLPRGPDSALAANGDLCASKLRMPTAFTAQNGMAIHQSTPIAVTGCKPQVRVLSHRVRSNAATITVAVPSAGRIVARGSGLSRAVGKTGAQGTVKLKLTLSNAERLFLSRHPGRKLRTGVKLTFTPLHGARLSSSVVLLIG